MEEDDEMMMMVGSSSSRASTSQSFNTNSTAKKHSQQLASTPSINNKSSASASSTNKPSTSTLTRSTTTTPNKITSSKMSTSTPVTAKRIVSSSSAATGSVRGKASGMVKAVPSSATTRSAGDKSASDHFANQEGKTAIRSSRVLLSAGAASSTSSSGRPGQSSSSIGTAKPLARSTTTPNVPASATTPLKRKHPPSGDVTADELARTVASPSTVRKASSTISQIVGGGTARPRSRLAAPSIRPPSSTTTTTVRPSPTSTRQASTVPDSSRKKLTTSTLGRGPPPSTPSATSITTSRKPSSRSFSTPLAGGAPSSPTTVKRIPSNTLNSSSSSSSRPSQHPSSSNSTATLPRSQTNTRLPAPPSHPPPPSTAMRRHVSSSSTASTAQSSSSVSTIPASVSTSRIARKGLGSGKSILSEEGVSEEADDEMIGTSRSALRPPSRLVPNLGSPAGTAGDTSKIGSVRARRLGLTSATSTSQPSSSALRPTTTSRIVSNTNTNSTSTPPLKKARPSHATTSNLAPPKPAVPPSKPSSSIGRKDLSASQGRRDSWETLPPSGRPSLSRPVVATDEDDTPQEGEGDVSWETIESRRISSLLPPPSTLHQPKPTTNGSSLLLSDSSFNTPQKPSKTLPPTSNLPTRSNLSYASPDADPATLHLALSKLIESTSSRPSNPASPAIFDEPPSFSLSPNPTTPSIPTRIVSSTVPSLPSNNNLLRESKLKKRDSTTLEEMLLKSSTNSYGRYKRKIGAGKDAQGEEEWLWEEGVSKIMREEMNGFGTPWRKSVVGVEEDGGKKEDEELAIEAMQLELSKALENQILAEEELLKAETVIKSLKREKEESESKLKSFVLDLETIMREKESTERLLEGAKKEKARIEQEMLMIEGDAEERRMLFEKEVERLKSKSRSSSRAKSRNEGDDERFEELRKETRELAIELAVSSCESEVGGFDAFEKAVKGEREVIGSQMASLAIISEGLAGWASRLLVG